MEAVNPKVVKEVGGFLLGAVALISILGVFGAAGKLGDALFIFFHNLFGVISYLFLLWLAFLSIYSLNNQIVRRSRIILWGSLIFIIFFSALVAPFGASGGFVGNNIFAAVASLAGSIATIIIMLVATITAAVLTFNISISELLESFKSKTQTAYPHTNLNVKEGGVSVFKTIRRKIGMGMEKPKPAAASVPVISTSPDGTWEFPSIELLEESTGKAQPGNISKNVEILKKTLCDFGVDVTAGTVNVGPTVTQYELKPSEGVKLNTIKARQDDLALALAAHPVRVEAPIPGKSAVGVEVPNKVVARVSLRELLDSEFFKKRSSNLTLPLGMDVAGNVILSDLRKMPHLLVAGATGSGKSVGLNDILLSLLYQNTPRDLRILLVDPKRVEFTMYNGIPHLLTPVVVEVDKTINLLRWAIAEMDRRFKLFEKAGSRDIDSYNEKAKKGLSTEDGTKHVKLPYIVVVIDELADLMMQAANEVEAAIVRLAQLARATGIHLVVATQRPSVDVITGLIKANITSRIAFAVASQVDSRTIIDQGGAEKLLGNGDMLFLGGEFTKPKRIQGAFVSEKDVKSVTDFLKSEGSAIYDQSVTEFHDIPGIKSSRRGDFLSEGDDLLPEARKLVVETGTASASFLQRRMKVGYARAARLLDLMEEGGIVGPSRGAKPRDILVDSISDDETQNVSDVDQEF
jgi:S-DNA-T family DNA segregation ATPase FtsK/SpoIIIE